MASIQTSTKLSGLILVLVLLAAPAASPTPAQGAPSQAAHPRAWQPHTWRAAQYAKQRAGDVRFAIVDRSGRLHKHRAGGGVLMASTIKVMFATAYLHQPNVRDRRLRDSDRDLLRPMIKRSDDAAANQVAQILGPGPINRLAEKAGMKHFTYNPSIWGHSITSARDQARLMYRLERYLPKRHTKYLRGLLRRIVPGQRWGFATQVPHGWTIRFKGGWGGGSGAVNHQIAFYERGNCRVSLAVMTSNNPNHDYGSATQAGVAKRLLSGLARSGC